MCKKLALNPHHLPCGPISSGMNCEMFKKSLSSVALCPEEKIILLWKQMGPSCQYGPYGITYGVAFLYLELVELSFEWDSYP